MAANRAALGSRRHALDGQNTRGPSSDTTAGTRVSPAISVTATAMASAGPIDRSTLSVDSSSARNAAMTTPAADEITSPTLATALTIACLGSSPLRSPSR